MNFQNVSFPGSQVVDDLPPEVKSGALVATLAGLATYTTLRGATKARVEQIVDDIFDANLVLPLTPILGDILPGFGGAASGVLGIALATTGIGERISDYVVSDSWFDPETGLLLNTAQSTAALTIGLVAGASVYGAAKLRELVVENKGISLSVSDANTALNGVLKGIIAVGVAGAGYAYYGRFMIADTNADGLCTDEEYVAWMNTLPAYIKPFVVFVKPLVAAFPGFDVVQAP